MSANMSAITTQTASHRPMTNTFVDQVQETIKLIKQEGRKAESLQKYIETTFGRRLPLDAISRLMEKTDWLYDYLYILAARNPTEVRRHIKIKSSFAIPWKVTRRLMEPAHLILLFEYLQILVDIEEGTCPACHADIRLQQFCADCHHTGLPWKITNKTTLKLLVKIWHEGFAWTNKPLAKFMAKFGHTDLTEQQDWLDICTGHSGQKPPFPAD